MHDASAQSLTTEAKIAIDARQWREAAELLSRAIAQASGSVSSNTHRLLIRSLRASHQLEQAKAAAQKALLRFPGDAGLLSQSAYNAKASKDRKGAAALLDQLLAAEGAKATEKTYERLIEALRLAKRYGEADARAMEGLARFPDSCALQSQYAAVAQRQGLWAVAAERLQELASMERPTATESTCVRQVIALRKAGQLEGARAAAVSGLAMYPACELLKAEAALLDVPNPESSTTDTSLTRIDQSLPRRHPYQGLGTRAFWNRAVENTFPLDITDWYRKKFSISGKAVATAGSCFAQHIGRHLRRNGYAFVDTEPAPTFLRRESWLDFGYGMYSARFGNVYSTRQLLQLLQRATGEFKPTETAWSKDQGFVDPFRPTIEPEPCESVDEVLALQSHHLASVIKMFEAADVFVFTLGLTETWESSIDGATYPVAPGVSGGHWDAQRYRLKNLDHGDVMSDLQRFIAMARSIRPTMKFILTVSPVPLMATASPHHVVVATSYSKSVLRAVAGQLAATHDYIDYFPSYEIIGAPAMRSMFYNPDMRTVSEYGVEHVMRQFFVQHKAESTHEQATAVAVKSGDAADDDPEEVACDEELLRTFGAAVP